MCASRYGRLINRRFRCFWLRRCLNALYRPWRSLRFGRDRGIFGAVFDTRPRQLLRTAVYTALCGGFDGTGSRNLARSGRRRETDFPLGVGLAAYGKIHAT